MTPYDLRTERGCVRFLIDRRYMCRMIIRHLDAVHEENSRDRRNARRFRETNNPMLIRRAETLDGIVRRRSDAMKDCRDALLTWGRELVELSRHIDAAVPQRTLLDVLNVNCADRSKIDPDDGVVEIAYVKGLEDSAMFRGDDFKRGPLAQAAMRFMSHELAHNERLKQSAEEYLFGKGGMLEFLPTYRQSADGKLVRNPPKLRLADGCDAK